MENEWDFDIPFVIYRAKNDSDWLLEVLDLNGESVFLGTYPSLERIRQELDFWSRNGIFTINTHSTQENADKL